MRQKRHFPNLPLAPRLSALVLAGIFVGTGCGGPTHLFYNAREMRHEPFKSQHKGALASEVAKKTKGKKVVWVDPDGQEKSLSGDESGLGILELPELGALFLATHGGERGGENDLRVHISRGQPVPISVLQDLEGNVRLISPPRNLRVPAPQRLTEDEIRRRFGLKGKLLGMWKTPERQAVHDALSLLSPEELATVQELVFGRADLPPDRNMSRAAFFQAKGCEARITVYSSGVNADKYRFVGEPSSPKNAMLHSVIHEIGHALENTPARLRYCESKKVRGNSAKNALILQGNALVKKNPVLTAYQQALGKTPAPTEYGRTALTESFAESFALFRVDPQALKRAAPKVFQWFKNGGHIKAQMPLS